MSVALRTPAGNPLRGFSRLASTLLRERLTPGRGAAAVFVGVFIANVPIYGFQSLAAIGIATLFRLNRPLTFAATFVNNPLLQPLLIVSAVEIGHVVLKGSLLPLAPREIMAAGPGENLRTWLVGSLLIGLLLGAAGAVLAFLILRRREAIRANPLHQRKAKVNSQFKRCDFCTRGFVRWKLRLDRVFELLAATHLGQGQVVDLGCGYGITLAFLAVDNPERPLLGCDLSEKRIRMARRALAERNSNLSVTDVRDFPFTDAGLILILDVLQYLEAGEQAALVRRCASALAPGGKLVFRVHDRQSGVPSKLALLVDRLVFLAGGVGHRPAILPASSYREMLARENLEVREHRFRNRLPLAHILFIGERRQAGGAGA